jgi:hypothetical protein
MFYDSAKRSVEVKWSRRYGSGLYIWAIPINLRSRTFNLTSIWPWHSHELNGRPISDHLIFLLPQYVPSQLELGPSTSRLAGTCSSLGVCLEI